VAYYMSTTVLAVILGIILVSVIHPGRPSIKDGNGDDGIHKVQKIFCRQLAYFLLPVGILFIASWHTFYCQLAYFLLPVGILFIASWHIFYCQLAYFLLPVGHSGLSLDIKFFFFNFFVLYVSFLSI
jgi:hypothetical protein